jgi:hypothetical protein
MPGYSFKVSVTLENKTKTEQVVSIPRGTILEPESTHLSYQSAVVSRDYTFRLNPGEIRSVILESECWNKNLGPPKGVPGRLTTLKGNVKKTTEIWKTSSNPLKGTILAKPSQNAHIFAAFANTNPELAFKFLNYAVSEATSDGLDVTEIVRELDMIPSVSTGKGKEDLCSIAQRSKLHPYVNAKNIRSFFIRHGGPSDTNIEAAEKLIKNVYALTSHKLASRLYEVAIELEGLSDDRKIAVTEQRRDELSRLVNQKYLDLIDSLPLLDEIKWA